MSIETELKVVQRYIDAMKRELPEGWHFLTVMMMVDPEEPGLYRIRVYCDREPTSVPHLMRHIADDLEKQNPPPSPLTATPH